MKRLLLLPAIAALFTLAGCADHAYYGPPPGAYAPSNALFDLASRNGFDIGARDGAHDRSEGYRPEPRRTPAYHDAPGYDPHLGPFPPYANTFRNAYLRGYNDAFYRR